MAYKKKRQHRRMVVCRKCGHETEVPRTRKKSVNQRFWAHVHKHNSGCWHWIGPRNTSGYGQFTLKKKTLLAHRFSWLLHTGQEPGKHWVLHLCDNPRCVNPQHLQLGDRIENARQRTDRQRSLSGPKNPRAKLTKEDVWKIRAAYVPYKYTLKQLAARYGVGQTIIRRVVKRDSYKDC